jgi:DnaJ-class molecular chaperone
MAKQIPYGFIKCDECDGSGTAVYSCCTGEPLQGILKDVAICPKCRELLGEETCEACEGAGYVKDENSFNYFSQMAKDETQDKKIR